jgi:hypothetical protein
MDGHSTATQAVLALATWSCVSVCGEAVDNDSTRINTKLDGSGGNESIRKSLCVWISENLFR